MRWVEWILGLWKVVRCNAPGVMTLLLALLALGIQSHTTLLRGTTVRMVRPTDGAHIIPPPQATKEHTIAGIAGRIVPQGFYIQARNKSEFGDRCAFILLLWECVHTLQAAPAKSCCVLTGVPVNAGRSMAYSNHPESRPLPLPTHCRLCLDNIASTTYSYTACRIEAATLELLPLEELAKPAEPSAQRICKVHVLHYDGRQVP